MKVAVCVCTYKRPKMLEACLASLAQQMLPATILPVILVIDNNEHPDAFPVVAAAKKTCPLPLFHIHEPRRGISHARNRALIEALGFDSDWVAFIDDDEVADVDWLANLMSPEWIKYPVLMGANIYQYPDPAPFWTVHKKQEDLDEALAWTTASGGNVRFSVELVKAGLWFNPSFGLAGGEDTEFFSRAYEMGFAIRKTARAITYEKVPPEKLTYWAQVYRAYWCAASDVRRRAVHKGWGKAVREKSLSIPLNVLAGLVMYTVALCAAPASVKASKKYALRGGKKMAKSAGRLAAFFGHTPQPYLTVYGD
jgi:succinoglycan biosynthesis protein ExoM